MELTTNNLIKIILGVVILVVVIGGFYIFFRDKIIDFFRNLFANKYILNLI